MFQERAKRHQHRLQVQLWRPGDEKRLTGYTTDVSTTGMFLTCHQPLPSGTRVRVEIGASPSFVVEAVVARVRNVPLAMRAVQLPGMALRFLTVEELVADVLPTRRVTSDEKEEPGVFRMTFRNREHFRQVFERDIQFGGLFVPTLQPAVVEDVVTVELLLVGERSLRFRARVVQRIEPQSTERGGTLNLLAGLGVEFLEPALVKQAVSEVLAGG